MKIIINADDFGFTQGKTLAIDAGLRAGQIHRASLIANGPAFDEAVRLAEEGGYKDRICFHLNFVAGKPLTDGILHTPFAKSDGTLRELRNREILIKGFSSRNVEALREECEAQMQRFRDAGFQSKHLDAHRWCIFSLPAWKAVEPLLKKYGFETSRTLRGHRRESVGFAMRCYYDLVFSKMKKALSIPEDWSGCGTELLRDLSEGRIDRNASVELYVHPDIVDGQAVDTLWSYEHVHMPLAQVPEEAKKLGELNP